MEDYEENIFQFDMVINFQLLFQYSLYDLLHMWRILEYHKTPPTFRKLLTNIIVEGYIEYTSSYSGIKLTIVLITGWKLSTTIWSPVHQISTYSERKKRYRVFWFKTYYHGKIIFMSVNASQIRGSPFILLWGNLIQNLP